MRRFALYFTVKILAFLIGLSVVTVSSFKTKINVDDVEDPTVKYTKWINKTINQIEAENTGFKELSNSESGDIITAQGYIDKKFLCLDVTDSQKNICTTVLIGNSSENKSLLIRFQVCSDKKKSNCIVWNPSKQCPDNKNCSNQIRIYDSNSKPTDLIEEVQFSDGGQGFRDKGFQIKITGSVSVVKDNPRLLTPIERLEIIEIR